MIKNKKVIYADFTNDESRFIVEYLNDQHHWQPVFFHSVNKSRSWAKERFPNAVFHDLFAMRQSNFDYSGIGKPVPIDGKILNNLSQYELSYLCWLEDTSGWNFSIYQRRRYYYDVLKYWNTVIHHLKPDLYVAYTWPHLPSDYPLYLLCKHCYDIPILFVNPVPLLDDKYYLMADSIEDQSGIVDALYLSDEKLELSDVTKKYLEHLRSKKATIPKHVADYYSKLHQLYRKRFLNVLRLLKMILTGIAFKKSELSFKKNTQSWECDASKLTNIEYVLFRWQLTRKNKRLKNFYKRMIQWPGYDQKYIYFPAPYQPEVLSNLAAGRYEDVFLILDMISQNIPKDWLIYYKEHPNTFYGKPVI